MASDDSSWNSSWTVGVRVWVEKSSQAVLGKGRLELLLAIDHCHSISGAARQMGMSYRRAWLLVQDINGAAGEPFVEATVGGKKGGRAQLTPRGRIAISAFRNLQRHVEQSAASYLPRLAADREGAHVHVAAAVSLEEVLCRLLADYALLQPTDRARTVFGASDELADNILAGAPADLFLSADLKPLDRLEQAGLLAVEPRTFLAENTLAAIAPANSALSIKKPGDLLNGVASRVAVADPASPLGRYTCNFLEKSGLYEPLTARMLRVDNSRAVVAVVRAGRADVGLVYSSDAVSAAGCRILFRAPRNIAAAQYGAAILGNAAEPGGARRLLDFLISRQAARRFRQCGFLPVRFRTTPD
ncbi:MAG TPA: molybdate ABC transporter substrate-binding protein [Gemmataceae bacterium]|nr:molybdate ABC transporter substrate-binding protein [Gemmataceae bacterium]